MEIQLEYDYCIGAGQCVKVAPTLFGQNESDGIVFLVKDDVEAHEIDDLKRAERVCPARAIIVNGA